MPVLRTIQSATVQLRFDDGTIVDLELKADPDLLPPGLGHLQIEVEFVDKPGNDIWREREPTGRRTAHLILAGQVVKAERHCPEAAADHSREQPEASA